MIALRNEFTAFTRRADAKIGLLKEIIGRIQNGEEVDVEGLLGTGNKKREQEWEEGIVARPVAKGSSNFSQYYKRLNAKIKPGTSHESQNQSMAAT